MAGEQASGRQSGRTLELGRRSSLDEATATAGPQTKSDADKRAGRECCEDTRAAVGAGATRAAVEGMRVRREGGGGVEGRKRRRDGTGTAMEPDK